jgi:hypothetical protein
MSCSFVMGAVAEFQLLSCDFCFCLHNACPASPPVHPAQLLHSPYIRALRCSLNVLDLNFDRALCCVFLVDSVMLCRNLLFACTLLFLPSGSKTFKDASLTGMKRSIRP